MEGAGQGVYSAGVGSQMTSEWSQAEHGPVCGTGPARKCSAVTAGKSARAPPCARINRAQPPKPFGSSERFKSEV